MIGKKNIETFVRAMEKLPFPRTKEDFLNNVYVALREVSDTSGVSQELWEMFERVGKGEIIVRLYHVAAQLGERYHPSLLADFIHSYEPNWQGPITYAAFVELEERETSRMVKKGIRGFFGAIMAEIKKEPKA